MTERDSSPFASALHRAILARGLTLDRIAHRLGEQGFTLSTATLSYWSRGRSQPERPESLAALAALEQILDVPTDSLRGLLVERVRKGRSRPGHLIPYSDLWGEAGDDVDQVIAQVGLPSEQRRVLSFHERYRLDATGAERHARVIIVIEAITDHVDRTLIVYRDDSLGGSLPTVHPVSGVRLGRVRQDDSAHVLAAELWMDEVLNKGDRTAVEYELRYTPGGNRSVMCERRFPAPIRQYVLEVEFDPAAVPARCAMGAQPAIGGESVSTPVAIGPSNTVRMVLLDQQAGAYRLQWEWE